jgi:hypothetical protein
LQDALENHLSSPERDFFNLPECLFLFDLTNIYFEGGQAANGNSRDALPEGTHRMSQKPWHSHDAPAKRAAGEMVRACMKRSHPPSQQTARPHVPLFNISPKFNQYVISRTSNSCISAPQDQSAQKGQNPDAHLPAARLQKKKR